MTVFKYQWAPDEMVYKSDKDIREALSELSRQKILFGHQSVGYDMVKGLEMISSHYNVPLNIIETRDVKKGSGGFFAHTRIGENKNPFLKINDFHQLIDSTSENSLDIAFFKFCYIDIRKNEDIQKVFAEYKSSLEDLKSNHPDIQFIVVTVPLRTLQKGPKAWMKKILGKPVGEFENNIRRNEFNELLKSNLSENYPVFDLARLESTLPGGKCIAFEKEGKTYSSLYRRYSRDGGHLNEYGMDWVASNLLFFLDNCADSK
jgi:hypothetical protein